LSISCWNFLSVYFSDDACHWASLLVSLLFFLFFRFPPSQKEHDCGKIGMKRFPVNPLLDWVDLNKSNVILKAVSLNTVYATSQSHFFDFLVTRSEEGPPPPPPPPPPQQSLQPPPLPLAPSWGAFDWHRNFSSFKLNLVISIHPEASLLWAFLASSPFSWLGLPLSVLSSLVDPFRGHVIFF